MSRTYHHARMTAAEKAEQKARRQRQIHRSLFALKTAHNDGNPEGAGPAAAVVAFPYHYMRRAA